MPSTLTALIVFIIAMGTFVISFARFRRNAGEGRNGLLVTSVLGLASAIFLIVTVIAG